MSIVKCNGVYKKYDDFVAIDNLTLGIEEGSIYGVLGPNGAGKSTLMNIIAGSQSFKKGTIEVFDKDVKKDTRFIKQNLGIVPQEIAIYDDLTTYENVEFFAKLYGLKGKILEKQVLEALEFVGLGDKAKAFPSSFSGGMKRRLNIACALAHKPKIVIMDEPTVGIDAQSRNHILDSVRELNRQGCTIIYTTHYMEEVESICSKIAILDNGKLIAEGSKEELINIISNRQRVLISVDDINKVDLKELMEIKGVIKVNAIDDNVRIDIKKETPCWADIMMYFTSRDIEIKNIESKILHLEEVFLTLTGRSLRD